MLKVIYAIFNDWQRYEEVQDISETMEIHECDRNEALEMMRPMYGTSLDPDLYNHHDIVNWLDKMHDSEEIILYGIFKKPYKLECRHED